MKGKICLTGDVHHEYRGKKINRFMNEKEIHLTDKYCKICNKFSLKATIFMTGKCVDQSPDNINKLMKYKNIEIGGHTNAAFEKFPLMLKYANLMIFKSKYGPGFYQKKDINTCVRKLSKFIGKDVVSWRTHGYQSNITTYKHLKNNGIKLISDRLLRWRLKPKKTLDLIDLPINVAVDRAYIIYPNKKDINERIDGYYRPGILTPEDWLELVKIQIKDIINKNGIATLLVHPETMKITNNFKIFEKLCKFISKYESVTCEDIVKSWK